MKDKKDDKHEEKHDKKPEAKPEEKTEINKASLSGSATEAWADAEKVDKKTNMNFPSEEAVKNAKEWVEENEK